MTSISFSQQQERRDVRYPLHLPVSIKLAQKEMHTHSENISVRGIFLSIGFAIPKDSTIEVVVEVSNVLEPSIRLGAHGKVIRVQPKASGDFAVAIAFERPFRFCRQDLGSGQRRADLSAQDRVVARREVYSASAWHTET